jgi:glycosyltransferase involved in cell wall biosynthesis
MPNGDDRATHGSGGLRIAYPVSWYRPDTRASCEQSVHTIAALARIGHRVTLFAPTPPDAEPLTAHQAAGYFGLPANFAVESVPSRWSGDSLWSGMAWLRQLFASGKLAGFDMMHCRLPAILALGRSAPIPFAFDHYRPWPDIYPLARGIIRRTGNAPQCMGFLMHSTLAAEAYCRAGVAADRVIVAHNGSHGVGIRTDPGRAAARRALGLDAAARIALYAGRVNAQKGLDQLLAMARLRPRVLFVIVGSEGDGPIEAAARSLSNVVVLAWQAAETLPGVLAAADVLLIPPSSEPLRRYGNCILPLKTFSYLAAGRPILAPALPDTAELLRHAETALLVEPDDPAAAAAALDSLFAQPELAARLGANARDVAERNSWESRALRLSAFFRKRLDEIGASGFEAGVRPRSAPRSAAPLGCGVPPISPAAGSAPPLDI